MILEIRRMVLIVSLMFWQGGFMFYGGVAVPEGGRILGSETKQGFITQAVTNYLNIAGAVCLTIWLEQLWHDRRNGVSKIEWGVWCINVGLLLVLIVVHAQMDRVLSIQSTAILDARWFDRFHKMYIGTSTLQWMTSLVMLFQTLRRWNSCVRA